VKDYSTLSNSIPATLKYEPGLIVAEGDFVIVQGRFTGMDLPVNWIAADVLRIESSVSISQSIVRETEIIYGPKIPKRKSEFMTTPSELLMRNFNEIFIELDHIKRAALLTEYYVEDCLWIHPGGRIVGRDGINEAASAIRKHFPEYRYRVTSELQTMYNVATCRWGSGMPGQSFHYTGTDFLEERDGRVTRLYTFIDQQLFLS